MIKDFAVQISVVLVLTMHYVVSMLPMEMVASILF